MNSIYIALSCVDMDGSNYTPKENGTVNAKTMEAHYSNRDLFGNDKEILLIEQVKAENKTWIYHEYLRYGIIDGQRSDSYFGITVITDVLCTDVKLLLDLCRKAFSKYAVGKILQPKGGTYKVIATLSSQESVRGEIEDSFANILAKYQELGMLADVSIPATPLPYQPVSLNNEKQVLCRLNPDDATPSKIIEQIKAGKKVAVSDSYPTLSQQQMIAENKRIKDELKGCKDRLLETQTSLSDATRKASEAQHEKKKLQDEISNLKEGNNRNFKELQDKIDRMKREYEAEISKYKAQGNYPVQKQLDELNSKIDQILHNGQIVQPPELQENQKRKINKDKKKDQWPQNPNAPLSAINNRSIFIVIALIIFIVIAFVVLSVSMCSGDAKDRDKESDKTEYFDNQSSDDASSIQEIPKVPITRDKSNTDTSYKDAKGQENTPSNPNAWQNDNDNGNDNVDADYSHAGATETPPGENENHTNPSDNKPGHEG